MRSSLTRFEKWGGFRDCMGCGEQGRSVRVGGVRLFVTIPDLGWLMLLVFGAVSGTAGVVYPVAGSKESRDYWRR